MGWRDAIAVGTLVFLTACVPMPPASRLVVSAAPSADARLTLRLDDPFRAARSLLYVEGSSRVKITIDGPGLEDKPFEQTVSLLTGEKLISLEKVPMGTHRLVSLQALDTNDVAIPGATLRSAGKLEAGANSLTISAESTAVGAVVSELLALDREKGTKLLEKVEFAGLTTAMGKYLRTLKAPHWSLLDAKAIAQAVYDGNGTAPATPGAFAVKPGRVLVRPGDFPPGAHFVALVNDPSSQPVLLSERKPLEIGPVAPGTWTLSLRSADPALPVVTQTVTVTAGGLTQAPVSFSTATDLAAMPRVMSAGASGVVTIGTADTLVMISGTGLDDESALVGITHCLTFSLTGGWASRTPLVFDLIDAASAVHGSKIFFFGGTNGSTLLGNARRYDPVTGSDPTNLTPLPNGMKLQGAVAGTIGDTIYLTGGLTEAGALNTAMVAYDPAAGTYSTTDLPALTLGRFQPASVVVDGQWYLFGGRNDVTDADGAEVSVAIGTSQAFTPGANAKWNDLPDMPTPRYAAGTVVVDGKIWVIGGATLLGAPSAAVEVYDPATTEWSTRPPLKTARANPSCGLLNGKIIVAGGAMGGDSAVGIPVGQVEELKP